MKPKKIRNVKWSKIQLDKFWLKQLTEEYTKQLYSLPPLRTTQDTSNIKETP